MNLAEVRLQEGESITTPSWAWRSSARRPNANLSARLPKWCHFAALCAAEAQIANVAGWANSSEMKTVYPEAQ
jgi:hypothetical protein